MIIDRLAFIKNKGKKSENVLEFEMQLITSDDAHRINTLLTTKEYQNILIDNREFNLLVGLPIDLKSQIIAFCELVENYPSGPPTNKEIMIELYALRYKMSYFERKIEDFSWQFENPN